MYLNLDSLGLVSCLSLSELKTPPAAAKYSLVMSLPFCGVKTTGE